MTRKATIVVVALLLVGILARADATVADRESVSGSVSPATLESPVDVAVKGLLGAGNDEQSGSQMPTGSESGGAAGSALPSENSDKATGGGLETDGSPDSQAVIAHNKNVIIHKKTKDPTKLAVEKQNTELAAALRREKLEVAEAAEKKLTYAQDEAATKQRDSKRARQQQRLFERQLQDLASQHKTRSTELAAKAKADLVAAELRKEEQAQEESTKMQVQEERKKKELQEDYTTVTARSQAEANQAIAALKANNAKQERESAERIAEIRQQFDQQAELVRKQMLERMREESEKSDEKTKREKAEDERRRKEIEAKEREERQRKEAEERERLKREREAREAAERARKEAEERAAEAKRQEEARKREENAKFSIHPAAFRPRNGMRIASNGQLSHTKEWTGSYTYTFWVNPQGIRGGWANLLHKGGTNPWRNHFRNPAVWFYPGQTRLHIRSGARHNPSDWGGYTNWGCDPGEQLPQHQWTWVAFSHQPGRMDVYYGNVQGNLRHVCQIHFPGPVQNPDDLYAGDSFHEEPIAVMADLRVYNKVLSWDDMNDVLRRKTGL